MKQRLVVMNGQRIVQTEGQDGSWSNTKVEKAGQVRAGIYNLHAAVPPSKGQAYTGVVVHVDAKSVYQQVGKACIAHPLSGFVSGFDRVPDVGSARTISYGDNGQARVAIDLPSLSRGRSR